MIPKESPCNHCTRVANPDGCENKYCKQWRSWFLHRWALIYRFGQQYKKGESYELEKCSHGKTTPL